MPVLLRDWDEGDWDEGTYDYMFYDVNIVDLGVAPRLRVSQNPEHITPPSPAPERIARRQSGAPERPE